MASSRGLMASLGVWSAGSIVAGAVLWRSGTTGRVRSFGRQTVAWGVVDAAIVAFGVTRPAPDPERLRRVLLANCLADLGYITLGVAGLRSDRWRGDGAAILVQGVFLLALDSHFAYHLPRAAPEVTGS